MFFLVFKFVVLFVGVVFFIVVGSVIGVSVEGGCFYLLFFVDLIV